MDDLNSQSKFYSFEERNLNLVNNQLLSDVCFLVGQNQEKIYAHQQNLALGSPVFHQMFYGELTVDSTEIEEPNLTSAGFLEMIRFIYGHNILLELNLEHFSEIYLAADKYLIHNLTDILSEFITFKLDEMNFFIIYDQLIRIKSAGVHIDNLLLEEAENMIETKPDSIFTNGYFSKISQFTLIELLKIDNIKTKEIDILRSISDWIYWDLKRKNLEPNTENKQIIFNQFKNLINYSRLSIDEIKYNKLDELLNYSDIGSLFLHLNSSKYNLNFAYDNRIRKKYKTLCVKSTTCHHQLKMQEFNLELKVNKEVLVKKIYTSIYTYASIKIFENESLRYCLNYKRNLVDNQIVFEIKNNLIFTPNSNYKLVFSMDRHHCFSDYRDTLSNDTELKCKNDGDEIIFDLIFDKFHCIKKIEFLYYD